MEAIDNFVNTSASSVVKPNSNSITTNNDTHMPHDDSVISAHDTGIYHLNKSRSVDSNPTPSAFGSVTSLQHQGNNVELLRKKLLMQDANETRL